VVINHSNYGYDNDVSRAIQIYLPNGLQAGSDRDNTNYLIYSRTHSGNEACPGPTDLPQHNYYVHRPPECGRVCGGNDECGDHESGLSRKNSADLQEISLTSIQLHRNTIGRRLRSLIYYPVSFGVISLPSSSGDISARGME